MPKMDGPELCRRVRELAHTPPIYVILLTVRDAKDDIVGGRARILWALGMMAGTR